MKATFQMRILEGAFAQGWQGGVTPTRTDLPAGSIEWATKDGEAVQLRMTCPCGCGTVTTLSVAAGFGSPRWKWDGNWEQPTLTPSVRMLTPCRWHGYLTAGEWRKV